MKYDRRAVLAVALWFSLLSVFLVGRCPSAAAQGDPVAGAKGAVGRLLRVRSMADMAPCLTNESAAMFGTMLTLPIAMATGMADVGPANDPATRRAKAAKKDLDALMKRYGVPGGGPGGAQMGPGSKEWKRFARQGRRFLVDVDALLTRLDRSGVMKGGAGQFRRDPKAPTSPEALRYRMLGPTRVAIRDPRDPKAQPMEARYEDGLWRIHLMPDR